MKRMSGMRTMTVMTVMTVMMARMPSVAILAWLLAGLGGCAGVTVDWTPGQSIDCALPLSTPSAVATRTVVFPNGAITDVPAFWDADTQLYIKVIRNTLVLQLRDPRFSATVQVFDDKGDLFLLCVHGAGEDVAPDAVLQVRAPAAPGAGDEALPSDADGAITAMMAAMLGGSGAVLSSAAVTRVEDGTVKRGRHLFSDPTLTLDLDTVFQGAHLRGYRCQLTYHGAHAVRFNAQRLWFPGALAVYASGQVLADPNDPAFQMEPRQTILLYYVAQ